MKLASTCLAVALPGAIALSSCIDTRPPLDAPYEGHGVAVNIAALDLQGVGDVVWDIEVRNGASPTSQVVFQRRLTSSGYGDSAGSASYIGPCDADPAVADNTVNVWVVGVYAADVTDAGSFNSGSTADAGAVTGVEVPFQNPTTAAPLSRVFTCVENADVSVQFDVALMRPAQQGFFDVAVNFNDIFCSAKFDCCQDATGDGCATDGSEDIELLFDQSGGRARTLVLGLACTAGPSDDVTTEIYMDPVTLDCDVNSDGATFVADLTIDPAGGPGNLCTAGSVSSCPGVAAAAGVDADAYLFQIGAYRGEEQLSSGSAGAQKVYWNLALGAGANVSDCTLRARATADDGSNALDHVVNGVVDAGTTYPYIAWDVDLGSCGSEQLSFDDPNAAVTARYTAVDDPDTAFSYHFGPGIPAGSFCDPACQHGGVCVSDACDCSGTGYSGAACETPVCSAPCGNGGTCVAPDTCDCATAPGYTGPTCEVSTRTEFTTKGTYSYTVPAGVSSIYVQVWGGPGGLGAMCIYSCCAVNYYVGGDNSPGSVFTSAGGTELLRAYGGTGSISSTPGTGGGYAIDASVQDPEGFDGATVAPCSPPGPGFSSCLTDYPVDYRDYDAEGTELWNPAAAGWSGDTCGCTRSTVSAGNGGYASGTLAVTPGDTFDITVGGAIATSCGGNAWNGWASHGRVVVWIVP